ncbi:NAD(P)H-binding protein [Promicromonospora sp. MEB111]|uniref:NAD(P)H-binding protein n=1 Tax=Promicromonospora sp. MEB111 TaxID=3040301 RepID=UPI00254FD410|nr:NAD(P)H-binding protein [Promicromonospora sp. MEB111]
MPVSGHQAEGSELAVNVFVIGIAGRTGTLLASALQHRGDQVRGLVRRGGQRDALAAQGIETVVGDIARMTSAELASTFADAEAVLFAAGSNGGAAEVTRAVDGDGVDKTIEAMRRAGLRRLALVSVLPESWRERSLSDEEEYYFAVKKQADVAVARSDLDWLILRPSLLTDEPGTGRVSLGPAELHGQIPRADVAETLAALVHEPRIGRQILELNGGDTPIPEAVRRSIR